MIKTFIKSNLIAIILIPILISSAYPAEDKKVEPDSFITLSKQILQKFYEFDPVLATSLGIHDYDGKYMNLEKTSMDKSLIAFKEFLSKLDKINIKVLSSDDAVDYKILKGEVVDRIKFFEELETLKRDPTFYLIEGLRGIYLINERFPESPALEQRLNAFPDFIGKGMLNISNPYEIYVDTAKSIALGAIQYFEETPFPSITDFSPQKIINSLKTYYILLKNLKSTDPTFPITKDYYLWKLKDFYFVDQSTKKIEQNLDEMMKNADEEFKNYINSIPKSDFEPQYKSIEDVVPPKDYTINVYTNDIDTQIHEVETFIRDNNFIEIPALKRTISSKIKPQFMLPYLSGFGFEPPPPFDIDTEAFLYIEPTFDKFKDENKKTNIFMDMKNKIPYLSIVQVAYPGHFLQKLYANSNPSNVRKIHNDLVFENGWSFYSEQLMYQKGLFIDSIKFSPIIIHGKRYRAIRAIAELKLCTGELDIDGAADLMAKYMNSDEKIVFKKMLTNSALTPLNYLSYPIGKTQIDELKDKCIKAQKDKFDEKEFHKKLLSSGSIPVTFKKLP
ncbi:DUF885 domain-containing protein [bacterium]|nr:DUF885 domain-containing protein [bacterium]